MRQLLILRASEAIAISPLDPAIILDRFDKGIPSDQQSRESSTSILSASDWRKIDRLVKVVADIGGDNETKKLSRTIHLISIQKQLLDHENKGLRKAILILKKRKKRGRPLPLD